MLDVKIGSIALALKSAAKTKNAQLQGNTGSIIDSEAYTHLHQTLFSFHHRSIELHAHIHSHILFSPSCHVLVHLTRIHWLQVQRQSHDVYEQSDQAIIYAKSMLSCSEYTAVATMQPAVRT